MAAATATLRALGAVDDDGAVTERGRAIAGVAARPPAGPRAARRRRRSSAPHRAAEVVALLAEDVRAPGGDLVAALRARAARRPGRPPRGAPT